MIPTKSVVQLTKGIFQKIGIGIILTFVKSDTISRVYGFRIDFHNFRERFTWLKTSKCIFSRLFKIPMLLIHILGKKDHDKAELQHLWAHAAKLSGRN
jgi:hypothetical protein